MAGSRGLGVGCVDSVAGRWLDGTYPGAVGVGDGARSLSGSGSSDSRSRWGGGGPEGAYEVGFGGGKLDEARSGGGEPNRLTCSTMETDRGRLEERAGGCSSGSMVERRSGRFFGTWGRMCTFVRMSKILHHVNPLVGGPSGGMRYSCLKIPM